MQFFVCEGIVENVQWAEENENRRLFRERVRGLAVKTEKFNRKLRRRAFFYIGEISDVTVLVGMFSRDAAFAEKQLPLYLDAMEIGLRDIVFKETTLRFSQILLQLAERNEYIENSQEVLEQFGLEKLSLRSGRGKEYTEDLTEPLGKKAVYEEAERFLGRDVFAGELDRIYAGKRKTRATGHPVHYMIETDDRDVEGGMSRLLLQALHANGRLRSRRYVCLDFKPGETFSVSTYDCLYQSCEGGAAVVRFFSSEDEESDYASGARETAEVLCEVMKKYRNRVLTVFCFPRECTKAKRTFFENLGDIAFIELKEDFAFGAQAERFLKRIAKDNGVRTDRNLFSALEADKGYLAPDLHELFNKWYNNKLKTRIYPQYKGVVTARKEVKEAAPHGSAYDELEEMIGLSEAKRVILRALDYYKAQRLFADKGMKADTPAMHMIFTGNPGTAKTSVARLFARIMQENDLLSKGKLIEVGRGDLVGKYVGWTAQIIQKKFREAKGSVLFIDEAYSLVDDRDGSYGDEAINTIVQEMENHRDDVVVIFAGYPDKMENFLQKNPGLRSRIAFHVPFADYNTEELCRIAKLIAGKKGLCLTEDACRKLGGIFDRARSESDFGNGRYVRNIIEKAKMSQATRLLAMDYDSVKAQDIRTILAADIDMPVREEKPICRPIGFRA